MYALRLATVALSSVASAQLTFSNVFNSGMVLMRDTPSVVWGFGNASIQVNTTFNGHTYAATVGSDGIWRQPLPSTPAGGPYSIAVAGSDGSSLALNNILFGDVYICSGQSNMQFTVDQGFNASAEAAAANDPKYSSIRVMTVGTSKASGSPLTQFHEVAQNWTAVSSAAIGAGNWSAFSAVCWFFARDVFDGLNGTVPLGMISSNWGGTVIRAWSNAQALSMCNVTDVTSDEDAAGHTGEGVRTGEQVSTGAAVPSVGSDPNADSALWNSMIYPMTLGPLSVKGFVWYQGESNVGKAPASVYACQQPALINTWRQAFNNAAAWFGYVILHPWIGTEVLGPFRDAQLSTYQTVPGTGYVPALDIGDPLSPFGSIHPRHKQVVGQRMANLAMATLYGQSNVPYLAPTYASASSVTTGTTISVTVQFEPTTLPSGGGLQVVPGAYCMTELNVTLDMCAWWGIQASDGGWYNATAALTADSQGVVLTAVVNSTGLTGMATSYGYGVWPIITLYSSNGLPALTWNRTVSSAVILPTSSATSPATTVRHDVSSTSTGNSTSTSTPNLALALDAQGGYTLSVAGTPWFHAQGVEFLVGGTVYSSASGSLKLTSNTSTTGSDGIGGYSSTTYAWTAGDAGSTRLQTTFTAYNAGNALGFTVAYPDGTKSQLSPPNDTALLTSTFPSFTSVAPQQLGVLAQGRGTDNCGWTVGGVPAFPLPSAGLMVVSPALPSDAPASQRVAVGFASLNEHMTAHQAVVGQALVAGPPAQYALPAGYSASFIMVAVTSTPVSTPTPRSDLGMAPGGPNDALYTLGDALLAYHGKQRPGMNPDQIHATLGVGTTAFYFRNPCDCGQWPNNTCPPDDGSNPYRLPNCMTYADTFLAVHNSMKDKGIPYGHMLLDSWWYGESIPQFNGVWEWEDDPTLMGIVNSFPDGLAAFSRSIGKDIKMWAHNGKWVPTSPYIGKYPFAPNTTMPQGPELWQHLFSSNAAWNLGSIKQDHVAEQIAAAQPIVDPGQVPSWLAGMGQAAQANGVSIEYCCSTPDVLINSVSVPSALSARSSPDYLSAGVKRGEHLTVYQWANGVESGFHYAVGLLADKDTFMSNTTERPHGGDGLPDKSNWPPFYNWTESNAVKHALMALSSGGPVHVSDRVGATNATLAMALMRGDGVLLRPSRPQTGIDGQLRSMMFGGWINSTSTSSGAQGQGGEKVVDDDGLKFNSPLPNAGRGEVYSAVSIIPGTPTTRTSISMLPAALPSSSSSSSSAAAGPCYRWSWVSALEVSIPYNVTAGDLALDAASMAYATCTANADAWVTYGWDLSVFGPATTAAAGGPVRPVFDGSAAGAVIPVLESDSEGYNAMPQVSVVAPVIGGWVVLGEVSKLLPMSPQRVTFVAPLAAGVGVQVGMQGAAGEQVTFAACAMAGGVCTQAPAPYTCTIPASGTAVLSLPAGTCA